MMVCNAFRGFCIFDFSFSPPLLATGAPSPSPTPIVGEQGTRTSELPSTGLCMIQHCFPKKEVFAQGISVNAS